MLDTRLISMFEQTNGFLRPIVGGCQFNDISYHVVSGVAVIRGFDVCRGNVKWRSGSRCTSVRTVWPSLHDLTDNEPTGVAVEETGW